MRYTVAYTKSCNGTEVDFPVPYRHQGKEHQSEKKAKGIFSILKKFR